MSNPVHANSIPARSTPCDPANEPAGCGFVNAPQITAGPRMSRSTTPALVAGRVVSVVVFVRTCVDGTIRLERVARRAFGLAQLPDHSSCRQVPTVIALRLTLTDRP